MQNLIIKNFNSSSGDIKNAIMNLQSCIFYLTKAKYDNEEFNKSLFILFNFITNQYNNNEKFQENKKIYEQEAEKNLENIKKVLNIGKKPIDDIY